MFYSMSMCVNHSLLISRYYGSVTKNKVFLLVSSNPPLHPSPLPILYISSPLLVFFLNSPTPCSCLALLLDLNLKKIGRRFKIL